MPDRDWEAEVSLKTFRMVDRHRGDEDLELPCRRIVAMAWIVSREKSALPKREAAMARLFDGQDDSLPAAERY